MTRRAGRIVKYQRTQVIDSDKNFSGERSPYWDWVHERAEQTGMDEYLEPLQGNPDRLSDTVYTFPQEHVAVSVGDITRQLTGQQRKVFELYVQEELNENEIGTVLQISAATVRTYLQRVRVRFKYYV